MNSPILAPAAVLVLWSMVILNWMVATRLPAFKSIGVDLKSAEAGSRYQDVEPNLPAKVNWKSHNYTHLMEQPTVFYAVIAILALAGVNGGFAVWFAWAYVAIRIVHSIWQCTVNTLPVRVTLFAVSSTCLLVLALYAVWITMLA